MIWDSKLSFVSRQKKHKCNIKTLCQSPYSLSLNSYIFWRKYAPCSLIRLHLHQKYLNFELLDDYKALFSPQLPATQEVSLDLQKAAATYQIYEFSLKLCNHEVDTRFPLDKTFFSCCYENKAPRKRKAKELASH